MKMREIIDKVSDIYREELKKAEETRIELISIYMDLKNVDFTGGKDITLHDYNTLTRERDRLQDSLMRRMGYYEGIARVREMLMDLGFDIEVKE